MLECKKKAKHMIRKVKEGISRLTMVSMGPNTLIQAAIPSILQDTPESHFRNVRETLQKQAVLMENLMNDCWGLRSIPSRGAMYLMVRHLSLSLSLSWRREGRKCAEM